MGWDQQVLMPSGGVTARAEHSTRIAAMAHALLTSDELARTVEELATAAEPGSDAEAEVRVLQRTLRIQNALGGDLVMRKARASSQAYETWKLAKPANDYAAMKPHYEEMFAIARESAARLSAGRAVAKPYDALIDLFEQGATTDGTARLFAEMRETTNELLEVIRNRPGQDDLLAREFDQTKLLEFMRGTVSEVGFRMENGRLDICRNAFCTNMSPQDVRMTTRPSGHLKGIVSSSLHEMGHALYEQNIGAELVGTPLGGGTSLGVHESQSRLWENIVGRSLGFWTHFLPKLQAVFPELIGLQPSEMFRLMNRVEPGFVRVGADEITYNAHIWIRFELEVALVEQTLSIDDLPEAWKDKMEAYLGIRPATDTDGVLQDVHWARGSVGYFPTYSLGNLMSYQIWEKFTSSVPDWEDQFATGRFSSALEWLTENVYRNGQRYTPSDLLQRVVGEPISTQAWSRGMRAKVAATAP